MVRHRHLNKYLMLNQKVSTGIISRVTPYLFYAEAFFLLLVGIGLIMMMSGNGSEFVRLGLPGLAIVLFLRAYVPLDVPVDENEVTGFKEMLGWMIIPKVLCIGSAISATALSLYLSRMDEGMYTQMFMIAGTTVLGGLVVLGVLQISGTKHLGVTVPVLYRAVPLAMIDFYLLFELLGR